MNGNKSGGANKNRIYKTIKVAPTTRAIRAALALSATMLALAGSGTAFAGTCSVTGLNEVTCSGPFVTSVETSVPVINLVPDLTLVLDDSVTVDPLAGTTGLTSTWGGDATVVNYGEINTVGADGIYMYSNETATLSNYGSIYTEVTGAGQNALDVSAYYDVTVVNGGDITATSAAGAYAVYAVNVFSQDGYASVTNQAGGSIEANSYNGVGAGIVVIGYYGASIDNAGSISASSFTGQAVGVYALSKYEAEVSNSGTIEAYSLSGTTMGASAISVYGDATVDNSGSVYAGGNGSALGLQALSIEGTAYINNSGTLEVTSYGASAVGVVAYGKYADVDNSGTIDVAGYTNAVGIAVYATYGANIVNSGDITVAVYGSGADAAGIAVTSAGSINVVNSGSISVTSTGDGSGPAALLPYAEGADGVGISAISYAEGGNEDAAAAFLYGYGPNDVNEVNTGTIYVNVGGDGIGMEAATYGAGNVYIDNQGSVTVYAGSEATGIRGYSDYGTVEVQNSGDVLAYSNDDAIGIYAYSTGYDGDITVYQASTGTVYAISNDYDATGIYAWATGTYADVSVGNAGLVDAYSYGYVAIGIEAGVEGYYSTIYVDNSGTVNATSAYGQARGIYAVNDYDSDYITIVNSGDVTASGYYWAVGISAYGYGYGDTTIESSGSVTASAADGNATGIYAYAYSGNISVDNSGSVNVYADGSYGDAIGISAYTDGDGNISVLNSGSVNAYAYGYDAEATGIYAAGDGNGDVSVDNSGAIYAYSAQSDAYGIYAETGGDGDLYVLNSGSILAVAINGDAYGIYTYADGDGDNTMVNSGTIEAIALYDAYGIRGNTDGDYGDMAVYNTGSITATSYDGDAYGIYVDANGYTADILVDNSGTISVYGYDSATGIGTDMDDYAATLVYNSGDIYVYAVGDAYGIHTDTDAYVNYSYSMVDNSGSITVVSGYGYAIGIYAEASSYAAYGGDYTTTEVFNSGSIDVTAVYGSAAGIYVNAEGDGADVIIDNSGSVSATAYYAAVGIAAVADGYYGEIDIYNTGDVTASAAGGLGTVAVGISGYGDYVYAYNAGTVSATAEGVVGARAYGVALEGDTAAGLVNYGSIDATATAYDYAIAEGASVSAYYVDVYNAGSISAAAYADLVYGFAFASGISAFGNYVDVYLSEDSVIDAYANGYGVFAVGVLAAGDNVYFSNAGSISAAADGVYGVATGVLIDSENSVYAYNYGDITATATGDYVDAVGIEIYSDYGSVGLYNSGDILAESDYYAVGVLLDSDYNGFIYNSGTISAYGAYSVAVWSVGASDDDIYNYGEINGALWMGDGDDFLYNDGEWNPGQTPSYFGAGDDGIVNTGTINMENSTIDLGTYSVYGNFFYNYGTINVNGADNHIDMGGPMAAIPSLNPLPFYNYGVIDFQDGAANDYLLITGDFAGDGDINVDVSGLTEVSDVLYIDGSVVTGTVNTINVDLLDLPDEIEALIPIVYVSGISVAGNFVLGDVDWDDINTFVTLDFDLIADIDATNATPDVFSLGIEVTGLSDPGTLAASVAPSVLSLMNSQVGTWRQRMGVIDSFSKGAISLWARVFTDKGSFSPDHANFNFGQGGNYDWDQHNSGVEAGIDFSVTDEFSLGLMLAASDADIDLDPGVGRSEIDADTWGVYGTWISPNGFYLDASYRWMSFDVELNSVAGAMDASGDAESFNLELGYAWTLAGGLKIEPQLQYTKTNVDNLDVLSTINGMTFRSEGGDSSRGRLGVAFRKSFGDADAGWLWTPYLTISAVREFDGETGYGINNTFFGATSVEGTSALLELGFTARHQNVSIYGGLNWQDGGAVDSFFGGQLGIRYTFGGAAPAPAPVVVAPAKTCAELDDDGDGVNNCDDKCLGTPAGEAVGADGCPVPAPEPVMEPKPYRG